MKTSLHHSTTPLLHRSLTLVLLVLSVLCCSSVLAVPAVNKAIMLKPNGDLIPANTVQPWSENLTILAGSELWFRNLSALGNPPGVRYLRCTNLDTCTWVTAAQIITEGGGIATDTIWDAKGDLAVGTGANTAIRLAVGANRKLLVADSSTATGLKWDSLVNSDLPASLTDKTYNGLTLAVGYSTGSRTDPVIPSVPGATYTLNILKSGAAIPAGNLMANFRFSNPTVTNATFIGNGVVAYVGGFDEEIINPPGDEISSAGTVDINPVELAVRITGTTTINTFTLDEDEERIVSFADALTLTHSATLVMLDGESRLTETGDYGVFKGYPAGVVKCIFYKKAAGGEILHSGAVIRNASITAPTGIVKADVGLSSVDNTADAAKPVSTATQTQLTLNQRMIDAKTGTKIEVTSESTIASASTVNLNSVAGPQTDVTGTTTITAITLAEGEERIARFTGILQLTHSANLLCPNGEDITTTANSYAVLLGKAAGVVAVQRYVPADFKISYGGDFSTASYFRTQSYFVTGGNFVTSGTFATEGDFQTNDTFFAGSTFFTGGPFTTAIGSSFTQLGAFALTLNTTADSNPTLPPGTSTLASESFANALISNTAYDATTWDGVTGIAPDKDAVRDKFESLGHSIAVYAAGTPYAITTTAAALDFGTTDPAITIDQAGTYLIFARAVLRPAASFSITDYIATFKLRRMNNTAADIANSSTVHVPQSTTEFANSRSYGSYSIELPPVIYTTAGTTDILTIFGNTDSDVSTELVVSEASIVTYRIR